MLRRNTTKNNQTKDSPSLSDVKALRKRLAHLLDDFPLPSPFHPATLSDSIAAQRGRPIRMIPVSMHGRAFGLYTATDLVDLIFFEKETSLFHQHQIIAHEVGHIICGHRPVPVDPSELPLLLTPDIDQHTVNMVLMRRTYSSQEDLEAEIVGSLMMERAGDKAGTTVLPDAEAAGLIRRIEAALEQESG